MAAIMQTLLSDYDELNNLILEDSVSSHEEEYSSFECKVRRLFFEYSKSDRVLSQKDHRYTQGIAGSLRGKIVSYGKYGSVYLSRRCKHSLEGFHLSGKPDLSKKVKFLVRRSHFPIPYNEKNSDTLKSIFMDLDFSWPLRKVVRTMIDNIDVSWDTVRCSIYLGALEFVYSIFLSHSNKETPLSVIGETYKLLLNPESQDFIKDYPLYCYREGCKLLPEGEEWLNSPEFSMISDEPDISFCFPWDYAVNDYEYALQPSLFEGGSDRMNAFEYIAEAFIPNDIYSRTIDLTKLGRYISDTAFYLPEVNAEKTVRKIDYITYSDLVNEIKNPTITQFEFFRKQIYVSQNNIRDTFIPSMKTFCALFVLESLCDQIIDRIPEIRIGKIQNRLRFNTPWYVMIDVKKFGLTFPKEVIIATMSVIERVLNCDLSLYKNAYDNYIININGEYFRGQRGFGLGNMNKLATIAHYLIAKQTGLDFYVYSDDIVYKAKTEPTIEILSAMERLYNVYGLPLNRKKCYISRNWEFLGESSHEYSEQNETNKCTSAFKNAFFARTLLEGELMEKSALRLYSECRDLWLKNHEIHPILREDLLEYPQQMGGFVETSRPVNYCYEASIQPSTFTAIRQPPKKFVYCHPDEFYSTRTPFDYYADSVIRNFHITERKKRSEWQDLQFWKKEENRYRNARIGFKSTYSLLRFAISCLDFPDHLIERRPACSQLNGYVHVPNEMRGSGLPSPYPVISVRRSDIRCLEQLSIFTDFPIYTKYMLELKLKTGIMSLKIDPSWTGSVWRNEIYLSLFVMLRVVEPKVYSLEYSEPASIPEFSTDTGELLISIRDHFGTSLSVVNMNEQPDHNDLGFKDLDYQGEGDDSPALSEEEDDYHMDDMMVASDSDDLAAYIDDDIIDEDLGFESL